MMLFGDLVAIYYHRISLGAIVTINILSYITDNRMNLKVVTQQRIFCARISGV